MDAKIIEQYKQARKATYTRHAGTGAVYQGQARATDAYQWAKRLVSVTGVWRDLEAAGKVKMDVVPDDDIDLDNILGDVFDPETNPEVKPSVLAEQRQAEIDRINRDGVWGIVGYYRSPTTHEWMQADSTWGFIGSDWNGSGYDVDVMEAAINAYHYAPKPHVVVWIEDGKVENVEGVHGEDIEYTTINTETIKDEHTCPVCGEDLSDTLLCAECGFDFWDEERTLQAIREYNNK